MLSTSDRGGIRIQYSKNPFGKKRDASGNWINTNENGGYAGASSQEAAAPGEPCHRPQHTSVILLAARHAQASLLISSPGVAGPEESSTAENAGEVGLRHAGVALGYDAAAGYGDAAAVQPHTAYDPSAPQPAEAAPGRLPASIAKQM